MDMPVFEKALDVQREPSRSVASFDLICDAFKILSAQGFVTEFVGREQLSGE